MKIEDAYKGQIVTSKNDYYIFVSFTGIGSGQACRPEDLESSYDETGK